MSFPHFFNDVSQPTCRHHNGTELQGTGEGIASGSIAFASMTSSYTDFLPPFLSIDTRLFKH